MRFASVHKVSSYLMVASAFAVLALSGELAAPWLLFTIVGGVASYFIEPTRHRFARSIFWSRGWNVLTLALFAYTLAEALRGEPLILCGVRFLCFLLVNKLCNRRASKDYQQAYVVSFLMLVAGTTLNTDLVYALCFVAYVVFATWTLTLFHLRREMEENYLIKHSDDAQSERVEVERILNSRRVVGPAFLAGTSIISAGVFIGSALIFFLFPRVGFGVFFQHSRSGMRMGFNDTGVELGQNGLVKDNDQVVMRVEFPDGRPSEPLYFRGIAFERYGLLGDGKQAGWSPASPAGRDRHHLNRVLGVSVVPSGLSRVALHKALKSALRQEVYLEPLGDVTVVFGAVDPLGFDLPARHPGEHAEEGEGDSLGDVFAGEHQSGMKYTAWSLLGRPADVALDAEPEVPLEKVGEFSASLQVPAELPPRIVELGRRITRGAQGPHQKVLAIVKYLQTNYGYTTNLKRDFRYDPLDDFLFVQKEGHCEYFATALAMLLRTVGVPARHVAGFHGGDWNSYGNYLQVRQRDAHAWVEVYLGAAGWVTFDPTPTGAGGPGGSGFGDQLKQILDTVQLAWFKYIIEYDIGKQVDFLQGVRKWWGGDGKRATEKKSAGWMAWLAWLRAHRMVPAGVAGLAAAIYLGRRRRRTAGTATGRAPSRRRLKVQGAFERATRALERRGTIRAPGETPRELGDRAAHQHDPGAAAYVELVALYYAARYGDEAIDPAQVEALALRVIKPENSPPA